MKDKILSLFTNPSEMTPEQIVLNIGIAAVLGFFIFISYYISHRGTIYSKKFNASLVIPCVSLLSRLPELDRGLERTGA